MTFQYITLQVRLSFQLLHIEISLYGPLQKISAALQKMSFSFFKQMQTSRFLSLMRNMLSIHIRSKFLFKKTNLVQKKEVNLLLLVTCQISKMSKKLQVDTNLGQQIYKLKHYPNWDISYEHNRLYLSSEWWKKSLLHTDRKAGRLFRKHTMKE